MDPAHTSAQRALCWDGRPWATGNFSCVGKFMLSSSGFEYPEPYLLTGVGNSIIKMNLDGKDQRRIVSGMGRSIFLDFHLGEGTVFWADTHAGLINRAGLDGTNRQKLLSSVKGITGLAVDWIENSVLWSNAENGTIWRVDTDGRNKKTVLQDLSLPSSVVVDPNERDRRLFWVEQGIRRHTALGSCNYEGNTINVFNQPLRSQFLRMTVFLDYVYLTDSKSKSIKRVNKYIGGPGENVNSKRMSHPPADVKVVHPINQPVVESPASFTSGCNPQTEECVKVCSHHSDSGVCRCKDGFSLSEEGNYCEDINECALWNHGCSLGCENIPGSYICTCPEGYLLLTDMKTCHEAKPCVENETICDHGCVNTAEGDVCLCPEGSKLKADGRSCTGGLVSADLDTNYSLMENTALPPASDTALPIYPAYLELLGPPPYLLFANVVDIRKMNIDGTQSKKLLEEARGTILAVDYDPVENKVYFADKGLKHIERASMDGGVREMLVSTGLDSPEGLAVDWINRKLYWTDIGLSSISRSSLNGLDREIFIDKDIQKPRGIAVHPQAQKVYWTDMGNHPAVERSGLNREMREAVVSAGLVSPSGLSVDHGSQRLFWCDLSSGLIESANLDGSDRHVLSQNQVGHPFALAVFEDMLWVSDQEDHLLYRLDMRTGQSAERLQLKSIQPAALAIVHPLTKPESDDTALSLNNKTLNDESTPLAISDIPSEEDPPVLLTEKMVSDQDDCYSLNCGVNAQCTLEGGRALCQCVRGFTADGRLCVDIDECKEGLAECSSSHSHCVNTAGGYFCQCKTGFSGDGQICIDIDECRLDMHDCDVNAECLNTVGKYQCKCRSSYTGNGFSCQEEFKGASSWLSTGSPLDVTSPWQRNSSVQSCPSTHDSYCLCVSGYLGERCQFSDLEWWELQQAEQEKKRNVAIAVCIVLLVTLLSIAACVTYCYGFKHFGACLSEDDVGNMSISEDSMTETTTTAPQLWTLDPVVMKGLFMLWGVQEEQYAPLVPQSQTGSSWSVETPKGAQMRGLNKALDAHSKALLLILQVSAQPLWPVTCSEPRCFLGFE
ncbi:Pro-epidermal growth factor [Triplophysa tibetana]|uniref:Pro-epidermal growth factor n=1 Tax=Triplophysa tibetana TaxID=1572043 RepID=A0A5A9NKT0_9TELE|nr:Pro-epidermal growth factor [Triplophysa tibetana]